MVWRSVWESWRGLDWRRKLLIAAGGACFIALIAVLVIIFFFLVPPFLALRSEQIKQTQAVASVQEVIAAIDVFSPDHGHYYPLQLQELVSDGYLDALPENPYTRQSRQIIDEGDAFDSGDIVYIPLNLDQADGQACNFLILLYGPEHDGMDIQNGRPELFNEVLNACPWITPDRIAIYYKREIQT